MFLLKLQYLSPFGELLFHLPRLHSVDQSVGSLSWPLTLIYAHHSVSCSHKTGQIFAKSGTLSDFFRCLSMWNWWNNNSGCWLFLQLPPPPAIPKEPSGWPVTDHTINNLSALPLFPPSLSCCIPFDLKIPRLCFMFAIFIPDFYIFFELLFI